MVDKVNKHTFEAVSLLILNRGLIDITIIPVEGQCDWVIPSNLLFKVIDLSKRVVTYQWQDDDIVVYDLLATDSQPTHLLILEGSSDAHRMGLQIRGELTQKQVGISQVKDIEESDKQGAAFADESNEQYVFQKVRIDGQEYVVQDLDELAYQLIDLDG